MRCAGMTGRVALDENGDRQLDYTIVMVQHGQYVPLFDYDAAEKQLQPRMDEKDWKLLLWPGQLHAMPNDTPSCGWENEHCYLTRRKTVIDTFARIHRQSHTCIYKLAPAHSRTHARTHARTRTHAHTHTHTII